MTWFGLVRTAFAAASVALLVAGCGGSSSSNGSSNGGVLVGAGSTFVFPLMAKWIPDYSKKHGVTITYGPIGSGGGIEQVTNRTVDFGASDAPLSADQQKACKGCLQIPWALGGTSIPYNVKGAPKHLKLTGELLAGIFLGKVKSWSDPAIAKLNPGAKLPAEAITPIYRADSSGTTYNLTDYLSRISPEWKSKVGTGTSVDFPVGTGGKGSSGVSAALSRAEGGITYVDTAYSLQNGFAYAMLRNRAGTFTLPTTSAVAAAADAVSSIPADNAISIVDPPASAAAAYPLSTFTYAIVPEHSAKADQLRPFLTYAVTDGQQFAPELQFAKLPAKIVAADQRTIGRITKS
jgi:phosphate transport system substrate-binding protein